MSIGRGQVRVLGPVDVVADDGTVRHPGSALRRTLLALLAIRRGEVLSTGWLMEHLWGDEQPESGVRALRFHVSQLRKECGDAVSIETRPGGYVLDVPSESIDAAAFDGLVREARVEPDGGRGAELCAEALALWRGEPFVDAVSCSALDQEAGRLGELQLGVIELSYVRRLEAGAAGELISDLSQLVVEHPMREGLWSSLIIAQYRAGRQAEALETYERLREQLVDALGLDPSPELQDLQLRVLRQDPDLAVTIAPGGVSESRSQRHNLPALATSFIEPAGGFDELQAMLEEHRLVTLSGSGGVGKTRLAIELAARRLDDCADGVRLIELAPVAESDAVVSAVGTALSVQRQPGMSMLESIVDWCRGRDLLLIVDNCEHVIDVAAEVVAAIIAGCPTVAVVATSREPLDLDGEFVHRLASLDHDGSVALFVQRATAADSTFAVDDTDEKTLVALGERLDGLPLAIELAAARCRSMSPTELLEQVDDRFRLLRRTGRGRHSRQHTLRATVEWSYGLLRDDERVVFERTSVFAGGFDLSAAEAVCAGGAIGPADVVDLVAGLVDKSMIVADRHDAGTRYRLLETLREFGEEQLVDHEDADGTRDRHVDHYLELAERTNRVLRSPREAEARRTFGLEWDNLRAAHRRTINTCDLDRADRLMAAIGLYSLSDVRQEIAQWVERTLALENADRAPNAYTYGLGAHSAVVQSADLPSGLDLARQGISRAPSPDDPSTALCWGVLVAGGREASHRYFELAPDHPLSMFERAIDASEPLADFWALGWVVDATTPKPRQRGPENVEAVQFHAHHVERLLDVAERQGSPSALAGATMFQGHQLIDDVPASTAVALDAFRRALALSCDATNRHLEGSCLRAIALATTDLDTDRAAARACRAALENLYQIREAERLLQALESAALVLAANGDLHQAAIVLGLLVEHGHSVGREIYYGFRERSLELVRRDDRAGQWMALGATMDADDLVPETIARLAAIDS